MFRKIMSFLQQCAGGLGRRFRQIIDFFKRTFRKLKEGIRKLRVSMKCGFYKGKDLTVDFTPELEAVVTDLTQETISSGGALDREFQRQIDFFRRNKLPIGEPQAMRIMVSLLKVAVAEREQLNGRLEQSVEVGPLFNRYYSKLQTVYDLDVKVQKTQKEMELAKHDYELAERIYYNAQKSLYNQDFLKPTQEGDEMK